MLQVLGTSAQAGAADILTLSPDANRVTVQAGAQGSDRMLSVLKEGDTFGRQVIVSQFDLPAGGFGEIALNAEMDMITFTSSISQSAYQVVFNQVGITSTQFSAPLPPLGGGDVLSINLDWSNPTSATVEIDQGGDGTIDQTLSVKNQSIMQQTYLPLLKDGGSGRQTSLPSNVPSTESGIRRAIAASSEPGTLSTADLIPLLPILEEDDGEIRGATADYTTTTYASGYYTFTNLPTGIYTITPMKTGQTFAPIKRPVVVPPAASKQDFTCTNCGAFVPDEMIFIPPGNFQMGCSPNDSDCFYDERPLHTVYLDAYSIDKYEVTNARYKACVDAGICTAPAVTYSLTRPSYYGNPIYANYPVINVDWFQAAAFCTWESRRLPTEAEWEMAARGSEDVRIYPWGDQNPDCTQANFSNNGYNCVGDTSPGGSYSNWISPYGALDMVGNVWEWVNDWYGSNYYCQGPNANTNYPPTYCATNEPPYISPWSNPSGPTSGSSHTLRGGSWENGGTGIRVSNRGYNLPENWNNITGFRCARTP